MAKLLIIEDDPYVRRLYEKLFRLQNYEIISASDGLEGLEKARSVKPDLILLDIIMPKLDGITVLRKLKEDPETANLQVIILTNIEDEKIAREAANLGAQGFIIKSQIPTEMLPEKINQYLKK